jgi:hypothetical protein
VGGGLPGLKQKKFAIFWPVFGIFENSNHRRLVIRTDCDKLLSLPVAKPTMMIMSSPTTTHCRDRKTFVMGFTNRL